MYYKEDWAEARKRFEAFWQRELIDRCCVAVQAPRSGKTPPPPAIPDDPMELERWWLDPEDNLRRMLAQFERTYYGGEAYPATTLCLGASAMAAFYGSRIEYRPETVWYHPVLKDIAAFPWETDPAAHPLYHALVEATRYYAEQCRGRYLVGLPELGSATDNLSLLRGMQDLAYDMIDEPDTTGRAIDTMATAWNALHRELDGIARPCNDGGCCIPWMQSWAPGPHYQMSADFCSILSPSMFRAFIVPELHRYLESNTWSVYHWDGADALKHADALLEMDEIKAIQWTPGEGSPPTFSPEWLPYYHRIQAAGKCLILPFVRIHEVEPLLAELSSRGLLLVTHADSPGQADALLHRVAQWTRD